MNISFTAHVDSFARDRLPPAELWPEFVFDLPELRYPERINCGVALLDDAVSEGHGARTAIHCEAGNWTYLRLLESANRIANVLVQDFGIVPGNRILLRGLNGPTLAACWLAVMKAGAIAVTTMPLLRSRELTVIAERAQVDHALCDVRLLEELQTAAKSAAKRFRAVTFGDGELEALMSEKSAGFANVETSRDDVCVMAFTSGTTGSPKATLHFHRDVLAMCDVVGHRLLELDAADICVGSPPLGFTFGLGALLAFPLARRGAVALVEQPTPANLLSAVERYRVTTLFTAPTAYRKLLAIAPDYDLSSLRRCISAGEYLPKATSDAWHEATGIRIIDGIGATEMMHIFIAASGADIRAGATGRALPGYQACVLDENDQPLPRGHIGRLAVKGPTGCRYLDGDRQKTYVRNGWNVTGDVYLQDEEGYFWFQGRADDMIISGGYNIAGPEVEAALMGHPDVEECAVIGQSDSARGQIVKAFVVLKSGRSSGDGMAEGLQAFVKSVIAPYKYPREIEFVAALPKTQTGKVQRFLLRETQGIRNAEG